MGKFIGIAIAWWMAWDTLFQDNYCALEVSPHDYQQLCICFSWSVFVQHLTPRGPGPSVELLGSAAMQIPGILISAQKTLL